MTELSPAAQAVWTAAWEESPVQCGDILGTRRRQIAAALYAAADQVVPEETYQDGPIPLPDNDPRTIRWNRNRAIRRQLLAIAAELNGTQSPVGTH